MKTIETQVDRFTTVRNRVKNRVARLISDKTGGNVITLPEYVRDAAKGPVQVNPRTHRTFEEGEAVTSVLEEKADTHIRSGNSRKTKMYQCRKMGGFCKVKSESKKLMRAHVVVCIQVNKS